MIETRLKKTIDINLQTNVFLDNLEKRAHRFQLRLTEFEYQMLEQEAKEAETSVAALIRAKLWPIT
jgi:hypothetical protein